MMTEYENSGEKNQVTNGADFIKFCTKHYLSYIGVCQDDDNGGLYWEPKYFSKNQYDNAVAERDCFRNKTFNEIRNEMVQNYYEEVSFAQEEIEKLTAKIEKYNKIREEVEVWQPPTQAHVKIKEYALNQIELISEEEDMINSYKQKIHTKLDISDKAVRDYINKTNDEYDKKVEIAYSDWQEELKRAEKNNEFLKKLCDSLEKSPSNKELPTENQEDMLE